MLHTCQAGMVPNHQSCGATPWTLASISTTPVKTNPAVSGSTPAAASASVRRASVSGAVATASSAPSVERVSRAAAMMLVSPM